MIRIVKKSAATRPAPAPQPAPAAPSLTATRQAFERTRAELATRRAEESAAVMRALRA